MQQSQVVMRATDPRRAELEAEGWVVLARSWGAQLTASTASVDTLTALVQRAYAHGHVREIEQTDIAAVLALDTATLADYPGGVATRHDPLTESRARPAPERRGFGAFAGVGRALAVNFVDLDGQRAETDFTVVAAESRGLGLGAAVKAASVLALLAEGVEVFRTGGAAENSAILATNRSLGYVIDEEWLTLAAHVPCGALPTANTAVRVSRLR